MKKFLLIFLTIFLCALNINAQSIHSFVENSVLRSGKFVKIRMKDSGVYRLTFDEIKAMGISNPANVCIFGYGGNVLEQDFRLPKTDDLPEIPIFMEKGSDGVFGSGDYILFYANGIHKWKYNSSTKLFSHQINSYSNYAYYFVSDAGAGKKIETLPAATLPINADIQTVEQFTDYVVHESEERNLTNGGKEFYGEVFDIQTSYNFAFSFPNTVAGAQSTAILDAAAASQQITSFKISTENSQSGTVQIYSIAADDNYTKARIGRLAFKYLTTADNHNFTLTYNKGNNVGKGYLNFIEINTRRLLKMSGNSMPFRNTDNLGQNVYNRYVLSSATTATQIWDITDTQNVTRITTENSSGNLSFVASAQNLKQYIAVNTDASFPKPETVGEIVNQNLHALSDVEFVIITHSDFVQQAERLAQTHRDYDNMSVEIVTDEQVYNEFSSGTPDATAIRWFLKSLYERTDIKPKYLLLFGKGTYDNRRIQNETKDGKLLTYQADNSLVFTDAFVSDDYFAMLADNAGTEIGGVLTGKVNVGVGRFSVLTAQEADIVVDKTINYIKNTQTGIWKNQLCFIGDDGDNNGHMKEADQNANIIEQNYPAYQINKIYLDAYRQETNANGETYPAVRTNIFDLLHKGLFFINYTGHAGNSGWANEQIVTQQDIKALTNRHLPLWVAVTCDFLQYDYKTYSAGEDVLLNPNGGGIGIIAASRPVYSNQNLLFNKNISTNLFKKENGQHYRLGDLVRIAKNSIGDQINKLCYALVGDPALMLKYPSDYTVSTDSINSHFTEGNDTLKALSTVKISGIITDENGVKNENFNGTLTAAVYDKMQKFSTLDNDKKDYAPFEFYSWANRLFQGKTTVRNGEYLLTFMMPKDIKYNYGNGRINYYAVDTVTLREAQGAFHSFIVGGINSDVDYETDGPEIRLMLNSDKFHNGDKVNETPLLIAHLNDEHGINIAGNGIGHDLLMMLDGDSYKTTVLNDFYESNSGSYKGGILRYKLPALADGRHTISLRAWDLLNNSTTAEISFEVQNGLAPDIFTVYNYPNPVYKTSTRIVVNHDRPETVLNTTVDIYNLAGQLVWTFSQNSADDIVWDLTTADGRRVKGGMYLYRVTVSTANSGKTSKAEKMLVIE